MTVPLPFSPLPGSDQPGSLAEAVQSDLDALATTINPVVTHFFASSFQSHAATGNQSITGLGFKPRLVDFTVVRNLTVTNASAAVTFGWGQTDGSFQFSAFFSLDPNAPVNLSLDWNNGLCLLVKDRVGTSYYSAQFVSFDADGFTINVTNANNAYRVAFRAYG